MTMAAATDIRTAFIGLLTDAGIGTVFDTLTIPLESDDLPAVIVYGTATTPTRTSRTSQTYGARYRIAVQVTTDAASDEALGAALDTFEAAVLNAVLPSAEALIDGIESCDWTGSEKGRDAEADRRRGSVVVTFEVAVAEVFEPGGMLSFDAVRVTADPDPINPNRPQTGWEGNP
jgi:hypothetical protein